MENRRRNENIEKEAVFAWSKVHVEGNAEALRPGGWRVGEYVEVLSFKIGVGESWSLPWPQRIALRTNDPRLAIISYGSVCQRAVAVVPIEGHPQEGEHIGCC